MGLPEKPRRNLLNFSGIPKRNRLLTTAEIAELQAMAKLHPHKMSSIEQAIRAMNEQGIRTPEIEALLRRSVKR
jgi:hypothetical protein